MPNDIAFSDVMSGKWGNKYRMRVHSVCERERRHTHTFSNKVELKVTIWKLKFNYVPDSEEVEACG